MDKLIAWWKALHFHCWHDQGEVVKPKTCSHGVSLGYDGRYERYKCCQCGEIWVRECTFDGY